MGIRLKGMRIKIEGVCFSALHLQDHCGVDSDTEASARQALASVLRPPSHVVKKV